MRLVYTGVVTGGERIEDVRTYYEHILPFYEKESRARTPLSFWLDFARRRHPKTVLEIGAGLGHVTRALGRRSFAVGLDVSLTMLSKARRTVPAPSRACFIAADMRRTAFDCRFDLIVAPGDPFSHLLSVADRRQALRCVANHLSERGCFVLEGLYRPERDWKFRRPPIRHEAGVLSISEDWHPMGTRQLWKASYLYTDRRRTENDRMLKTSFVARAWDPRTVRGLMRSCGLQVEQIWGDFDRRPFRRDAGRIVIVSRRFDSGRRSRSHPRKRP